MGNGAKTGTQRRSVYWVEMGEKKMSYLMASFTAAACYLVLRQERAKIEEQKVWGELNGRIRDLCPLPCRFLCT